MKKQDLLLAVVLSGFIASCGGSGGGDSQNLRGDAFYHVQNPKTQNEQLLAYDWNAKKAFVVNKDVVLESAGKVFLVKKEKDGDYVKDASYDMGIYLDPNVDKEERTGIKPPRGGGKPESFTYTFFKDSALKIFHASSPRSATSLFNSNDIPATLKERGIKVLGSSYKISQPGFDLSESYITINAYDSLPDQFKNESYKDKNQAAITFNVNNKALNANGVLLASVLTPSGAVNKLILSKSDPYKPSASSGNWALYSADKNLKNESKISDGEFFYAAENSTHIYFFKQKSKDLYALSKQDPTSLVKLSGAQLAGEYNKSIRSVSAIHGGVSYINGGSSLSLPLKNLSSGDTAYLAYDYDLQKNVGELFIFGAFGMFKSAQVFSLKGTVASKIFDNSDGTDKSLVDNNKQVSGHINLIGLGDGGKLFVEMANFDGNAALGGKCTKKYPSHAMPGMKQGSSCLNLFYGSIDTSVSSAASKINELQYNGKDLNKTGLEYFVARRMAPFIANDKLIVSLFDGGNKQTGYKYKQYIYDLNGNFQMTKDGRNYILAQSKREDGRMKGKVITWDSTANTITDDEGKISIKAALSGKKMTGVSSQTNGIPYSGIANLGMFKDDTKGVGDHAFKLFLLSTKDKGEIKEVELLPYGQWIYE